MVGTVQDDGPTPLAAGLVPAVAGFTQSESGAVEPFLLLLTEWGC